MYVGVVALVVHVRGCCSLERHYNASMQIMSNENHKMFFLKGIAILFNGKIPTIQYSSSEVQVLVSVTCFSLPSEGRVT